MFWWELYNVLGNDDCNEKDLVYSWALFYWLKPPDDPSIKVLEGDEDTDGSNVPRSDAEGDNVSKAEEDNVQR